MNLAPASCKQDFETAKGFTNWLGYPHVFQTFDDSGAGRGHLVRVITATSFGQVASQLAALNDEGGGVFITINQTDGRGRKAENITAVRALFVDSDGTPFPAQWHKKPDAICWRDKLHWHAYWRVNWPIEAATKDRFAECQKRLAAHYKTDPAINDLPRVMRVPGFLHRKAAPVIVRCKIRGDE